MDPVTCPMCEGAIPGREIRSVETCPSCGADLSKLIRQRLTIQLPPANPPPQPTSLIARAALLSFVAPCFGIAAYLFGRRVLGGSPVEMRLLGVVSLAVIAAGFIFGIVAFFAPRGQRATAKSVAGICINGLLLSFAIFSIFTRSKVAARENQAPQPPRKPWYYLSGR